jgi:erythronate-4-phosphate dehydrogenase
MRIVADAEILSVHESFSGLGELQLVEGRLIDAHSLQNADALLVRSVTRVDEQLLANTPVRFVGTATSGTDHVDIDYLHDRKIHFSDARGCNANAVTEYCFGVFALLAQQRGLDLRDKLVALIGVGRVGSLLAQKLRALDVECVAFDPFLEAGDKAALEGRGVKFVEFDEALRGDLLTFHVPLTRFGSHPTYHQLTAGQMMNLKRDCILLNTSRGAVVCNSDLKQVLKKRDDLTVVLDVWEPEPELDRELLDLVFLGTPHIAGYSLQAKLNSTRSLLTQFCNFFGASLPAEVGVDGGEALQQLDGPDATDRFCARPILEALPLVAIDTDLRSLMADDAVQGSAVFDQLRRRLTGRSEFSAYRVAASRLSSEQERLLKVLGFSINRH